MLSFEGGRRESIGIRSGKRSQTTYETHQSTGTMNKHRIESMIVTWTELPPLFNQGRKQATEKEEDGGGGLGYLLCKGERFGEPFSTTCVCVCVCVCEGKSARML